MEECIQTILNEFSKYSLLEQIFYILCSPFVLATYMFNITYKEANVLLFYLIFPSIWAYMINKKLGVGVSLVSLCLFLSPYFPQFSVDSFDTSVEFLKSFNNIGINYELASILVYLVVPLIIFIILYVRNQKTKSKRSNTQTSKSDRCRIRPDSITES